MKTKELITQMREALEYAIDMTKPEGLSGCDCQICTSIAAADKWLNDNQGQNELARLKVELENACRDRDHYKANSQGWATGLTMRDYFAAKAMQGFASDENVTLDSGGAMAKHAYAWADAMLEARK